MPKRIVHMLNSMGMGGVENFLMNVYRNIDREKFQFDFILQSDEKSYFEDEITKLGGKIYKIPRFEKNPIKHIMELKKILKENKYSVIHRHTANSVTFVDLLIANRCKVPIRIAHSHNTSHDNKIVNKLFGQLLYQNSNIHLACSIDAGKWLYGSKKNFEVINNGIDCEKYEFSQEIRNEYRKQFKLDDDIAICHIGRFNEQKNHIFLLKVFYELCKISSNYKLFLCGDGNLKKDMEDFCQKHNIADKVVFLGIRDDVSKILQAMDIFAFPSLYEGLGIVLIEAQMTNMPSFISEAIPDEAIYNGNVKKLKINEASIIVWCDEIRKTDLAASDRRVINSKLVNEYDEKMVSKRLCEIYEVK